MTTHDKSRIDTMDKTTSKTTNTSRNDKSLCPTTITNDIPSDHNNIISNPPDTIIQPNIHQQNLNFSKQTKGSPGLPFDRGKYSISQKLKSPSITQSITEK